MDKKEIHRVNDWLDDKTKKEGCTKKQVELLREYKQLFAEFGRIGVLAYFLTVRLGVTDCQKMMMSVSDQRDYIYSVMCDLKKYSLDNDLVPMFRKNIKSLRHRVDHVFRICTEENLRLTKYYPYFKETGFDQLIDFNLKYSDGPDSVLDVLIPKIEAWNAEHQDDIDKHMESVQHEIEVRDAHRQKIRDEIKAEKAKAAEERRKAREDLKDIKKFHKKEAVNDHAMERSYRHLYLDAEKDPKGLGYTAIK